MIMHALVSPEDAIVDRRRQDPDNLPATRPGWRWLPEERDDAPVNPDTEVATEEVLTVEEDRVVRARGKRALTVEELKAEVARLRWEREVAGIEVVIAGETVPLSTARGDDRQALDSTYAAIRDGLRQDSATFKFADLTSRAVSNADMRAAVVAALAHIQACFDLEGLVAAEIDAGMITNKAQVRAAFEAS
ncbi:DUF4376 domain-containing protein [Afifella aestuarii]|uniref:DUF4376 domain-containing protein n=1 Tax=Afifella aestuarii TaxID=1909496 RepID=UPI0013E36B99|nr:DUF4376 domain-containing protein [Afifella aestuarii]